MKKEYNLKDRVWIHNGEKTLVEGRVVEIIDLSHLNEGHSADRELYIIELKTGIDDVYEVRDYEAISPDAEGPINLWRNSESRRANRYFKKVRASDTSLPHLGEEVRELSLLITATIGAG